MCVSPALAYITVLQRPQYSLGDTGVQCSSEMAKRKPTASRGLAGPDHVSGLRMAWKGFLFFIFYISVVFLNVCQKSEFITWFTDYLNV